jgi:POT family proton-dependent oligopeptide transporter
MSKETPNEASGSHAHGMPPSQGTDKFSSLMATIKAEDVQDLPGPIPTPEEMATLPRTADRLPAAAWLVVLAEFCERLAYYGISSPMQNYCQFPYDPSSDQPGALGLGQSSATAINLTFQFLCYFTPLLGAVVADQYLGKFKTILVFAVIYLIGLIVLVSTSIPPSILAGAALPGLIIAIVIISVGTGGIKSNVSPLVAEQYPHKVPFVVTDKTGKKVIKDPGVTIQSIFNWFYLAINCGSLVGVFAATYSEKYVGFWLAYLIPSLFFVLVIGILLLGRNMIRQVPPGGSVIVRASRALGIAIKQGWDQAKPSIMLANLENKDSQFNSTTMTNGELAVKDAKGKRIDWDDAFVDDLHRALNACKVFLFYPFYWVIYSQQTNNLVSQAASMDTGNVPNDVLQNFDPLFLIALIPIFDTLIYPMFRRLKINLRPILRISLGFWFAGAAMAYTSWVQSLIYADPQQGKGISVWYQIPSYFFIAVSEIFASITGLEFAFDRAPASMKSIVMSLFLTTSAGGSILGFALVPVSQDPYLVTMYYSLAIVAFVMGTILYLVFRHLDREDKEREEREAIEAQERLNFGKDAMLVSLSRAATMGGTDSFATVGRYATLGSIKSTSMGTLSRRGVTQMPSGANVVEFEAQDGNMVKVYESTLPRHNTTLTVGDSLSGTGKRTASSGLHFPRMVPRGADVIQSEVLQGLHTEPMLVIDELPNVPNVHPSV